jgi:hypothetical protein
MNQSVKYRQNAAECYEVARVLSDSRHKAKLLAMAQSWISLADQVERDHLLSIVPKGGSGIIGMLLSVFGGKHPHKK